jgi:hypothetical protein
MDKGNYSPRFTIILLIALVVSQVLMFNYLRSEINRQINQCYEAINTSTILQGALVNILVKKNIVDRDLLLKEASALSSHLSKQMEQTQKEAQTDNQAPAQEGIQKSNPENK